MNLQVCSYKRLFLISFFFLVIQGFLNSDNNKRLEDWGLCSSAFAKYQNALSCGYIVAKSDAVLKDADNIRIENLDIIRSKYETIVRDFKVSQSPLLAGLAETFQIARVQQRKNEDILDRSGIMHFPNQSNKSPTVYFATIMNQFGPLPMVVLYEKDKVLKRIPVSIYDSRAAAVNVKNSIEELINQGKLFLSNNILYGWILVSDAETFSRPNPLYPNPDALLASKELVNNLHKCDLVIPFAKKQDSWADDDSGVYGVLKQNYSRYYFLVNNESRMTEKSSHKLIDGSFYINSTSAMFLHKFVKGFQPPREIDSSARDYVFAKNGGIERIWTDKAHKVEKGLLGVASISSLVLMRSVIAPWLYKNGTLLLMRLRELQEKLIKQAQNKKSVAELKKCKVTPRYPDYFEPDSQQIKFINYVLESMANNLGLSTGILLTSIFGEGKSCLVNFLAKLAQERYNATFLVLSSAVITSVMNSGTKSHPLSISDVMNCLVEAIRELAKESPIIVFMDEVDMFLPNEKSANLTKEQLDLYHEALTKLPEMVNIPNVYLIAAVNNLKDVSVKILNPHRYGKIEFLDNPSLADREGLFSRLCASSKMNLSKEEIKEIAKAAGPITLRNKTFETPISRAHVVNAVKESIFELVFNRLSENDPLRKKITERLKNSNVEGFSLGFISGFKKLFESKSTIQDSLTSNNIEDVKFSSRADSLLDLLQVFTPRYKKEFMNILIEKIYEAHVNYAFTLKLAGENLAIIKDLRETYGSSF